MAILERKDDVLAHTHELMRQQRFIEAIALLRAALREQPDDRCEILLAQCRYQAYLVQPPQSTMVEPWPLPLPLADPFADVRGVPEIDARELNAETLSAGIRCHGALLVRGLLQEPKALQMAAGVQHAIEACEAWNHSAKGVSETAWYSRLEFLETCKLMDVDARRWLEGAGGVWVADSPHMLHELTELFESSGVTATIAAYFGERPMLSVGKSTLRRVPATEGIADWHQDGAFMGSDIRSVNVWLSLSHCGQDASGLEFVPRRLSEVLPTGSHGARFDWTVGPGMVDLVAEGAPTVSPVFAPGDALLFDHFFLHRTGTPPGMTKARYAIESWFFAPSGYPAQQVPLWL